jgi:hypothetical protein
MNKKTENRQTALARNEELVIRELPEEVLVYDLIRHKAHCLNRTAAFIWSHCDGQTTADEIAKQMQEEWDTPVSEDAVWFTLDKLSKADLLQEAITPPQSGISRRSAMRRLGFGALLAAPVVMSIVTPTAAAAASVPVECQACVKKINGVGACPNICDTSVLGTCYDNSGCGAGQLLIGGVTCTACLSGAFSPPPGPGGLTVSWSAPD